MIKKALGNLLVDGFAVIGLGVVGKYAYGELKKYILREDYYKTSSVRVPYSISPDYSKLSSYTNCSSFMDRSIANRYRYFDTIPHEYCDQYDNEVIIGQDREETIEFLENFVRRINDPEYNKRKKKYSIYIRKFEECFDSEEESENED